MSVKKKVVHEGLFTPLIKKTGLKTTLIKDEKVANIQQSISPISLNARKIT